MLFYLLFAFFVFSLVIEEKEAFLEVSCLKGNLGKS